MNFAPSLLLSASGVTVAAVAYYNRDKPEWQRDMQRIYILAFMQVATGRDVLVHAQSLTPLDIADIST